ncbi:MAG: hypothetical protein R3F49_12175 [Planctomycetota bacterium]
MESPGEAVRALESAASKTLNPSLSGSIDLSLASALHALGRLQEWFEVHRRCARRSTSSERTLGAVFGTFAALRTGETREAAWLLERSYDAEQRELATAHAELQRFLPQSAQRSRGALSWLGDRLKELDHRGLWLELVKDALHAT